jgi:uncharacterized repeat protein (TIGR01451 family)
MLQTRFALLYLLLACVVGAPAHAQLQTPITRSVRFTGLVNFVTTGGSLRTQPDTVNSCAVGASSTQNLSGMPAGTTVLAAYLYWGGSATTSGGAIVIDNNVTFKGASVIANRTFTASYNNAGTQLPYFGGVADVTALVTGNGSYTFSGLTVNAGNPHCAVGAVAGGWGLVVIYQGPSERLRSINIFDGLQYFRGSALTLTPDGFRVPTANIDGRVAVITWEGDPGNSGPLNGFAESFSFNGATLDDGLVPAGSSPTVQQYDGTINSQGVVDSYGVDVDTYDVSALLSPGQESATTTYSTGGDLVLLTAQIVSVTTERSVDLSLSITAVGNFSVGANGSYTLSVANSAGAIIDTEANTISVTDTLPAGLSYVSAAGTGWTCAAAGQVVTCTHPPPLAPGQSLPSISLTVAVTAAAWPSVTNSASVSSSSYDGNKANNTGTAVKALSGGAPLPALTVQKLSEVLSDPIDGTVNPKRIPGAVVRYSIVVSNAGFATADSGSVAITDPVPAGSSLYVSTASGSPVDFVDGTPASNLSFNFATQVAYSNQPGGGPPYNYVPAPDANGFDAAVSGLRVTPQGVLAGSTAAGNPGFTIRLRVRVQ